MFDAILSWPKPDKPTQQVAEESAAAFANTIDQFDGASGTDWRRTFKEIKNPPKPVENTSVHKCIQGQGICEDPF